MASEIRPKIWVGDCLDGQEADEFERVEFDRVLALASGDHPNCTDKFHLPDGGWDFDREHDYQTFEEAVNTLRRAVKDGDTVLVHCNAGQSRSTMTVSAALAVEDGTSFDSAYSEVRSKHPPTQPSEELRFCATKYVNRRRFGDEDG